MPFALSWAIITSLSKVFFEQPRVTTLTLVALRVRAFIGAAKEGYRSTRNPAGRLRVQRAAPMENFCKDEGPLSSEVRIQLLALLKVVSLANLGRRNDLKKLCGIALELLDNAQ